jgi:RimJ/RimL family protein N-acetyltransferase
VASHQTRTEDQPILSDGVVWLTPWRDEDASAFGDFNLDPDHARWFDQPDPDPDPDRRRDHHADVIRRYHDEWMSGASLSFALRIVSDGGVIGAADLQPRPPATANIAYAVTAGHRGNGYATRAVRLLAEAGLTRFGFQRIELICDVENGASRRVADKAGFTLEGIRRGGGRYEYVPEFTGRPRDQALYSLITADLEHRA